MTTEEPLSPSPGEGNERPRRPHPPPALWVRLLLLAIGWFLLLLGVAGLVLPGIQGILTMLLGAAILSIASETAYRLLRRLMRRRFPGAWRKLEAFRERWRQRLARRRR